MMCVVCGKWIRSSGVGSGPHVVGGIHPGCGFSRFFSVGDCVGGVWLCPCNRPNVGPACARCGFAYREGVPSGGRIYTFHGRELEPEPGGGCGEVCPRCSTLHVDQEVIDPTGGASYTSGYYLARYKCRECGHGWEYEDFASDPYQTVWYGK